MKICVLISSDEQKKQAGVRIRYMRLQETFNKMGHRLDLIAIQDFQALKATHDVYIISKCYDARSFVVAKILQDRGKPCGIDLFDDYFSQLEDSRFIRLRYWLQTMLSLSAFVLCSTEKMKMMLLKNYDLQSIPIHIMNDSIQVDNKLIIEKILKQKIDLLKQTKSLTIGWFGMGDNPNFPVGLIDLVNFGNNLLDLRGKGYEIKLEILTNTRAMTPENLSLLGKLFIPYTIAEWSEKQEEQLLQKAFVCFIPVNNQNFSQVKTLNRAITALTSACQVINVGYDLYEPLSDYIYRDATKLLIDLQEGHLKLSDKTLNGFMKSLKKVADIEEEANQVIAFCKKIEVRKINKTRLAIIHGENSQVMIHKYTQKMQELSVSSPFTNGTLFYNIMFKLSDDCKSVDLYILKKTIPLVASHFINDFEECVNMYDNKYKKMDIKRKFPEIRQDFCYLVCLNTLSSKTASYKSVMLYIGKILSLLFPNIMCLYSEQSKAIPWSLDDKFKDLKKVDL